MKGLIQASLIMAAIIGIGFLTSNLLVEHLTDREVAAYDYGLEEGRIHGYETGLCNGETNGYQEGSKAGYAASQNKDISELGEGFHFSYYPTYDEVRAFLDQNDKTTAAELNNCAEANGIRSAYVRCQIARQTEERTVYVYNIVAFETADRGLIFIRPRSHEEIRIELGQSYSDLNGFPSPAYDDTINKITIVW